MFKIEGLDRLQRELREAQKALSEIDEQLGTVQFDPNDPTSIEAAIVRANTLIEERLGDYASNSIVAPIAQELKEKYREAIIEEAREARLKESRDGSEA